VETTQHGLRRELKLWDLVLMQVVLIFSLSWSGLAAKQGSTQVVLWLIAIVLFYLPLAAVVMKLSRAMPVEGGVYQWTKEGLSPFAGYMAGWNISLYAVFAFSSTGSALANGFAWAAGPGGSWMAASRPFALTLTAIFCLIAYSVNVRGLQVGKWLSGGTSLLWIAMFLVLLYLLIKAWVLATPLAHGSLSLAWPGLSLLTISILAKMAIGALAGFDNSAVFAEECRKPENDVARSVLIATPMIALMYILGTSALLAYTAPVNIDVAAPVQQVMHAGFGSSGLGVTLTLIAVGTLSIALIAGPVIFIGMVARLPMVAGWDGLLPGWRSELHPTFRTPSKAISAVAASLMLMGAFSLWGAGNQEAVQVTLAAGIASLCLMYMLLFGVILFGFRSRAWRPGIGIRMAALAAFSVAFLSLIFEIVPVGDVASPLLFAGKVTVAICAANGLGAYLYWRGTRRVARLAASSQC
jgi:amino acid transporter